MRITSKKIIAILSCLMIGATMLVGCSSSNEKSEEESNSDSKNKLIVGVSTEYYPWCFKENDENKGFEVDVWKEIEMR